MGRSVQPASDTLDWMPAPGPFAVRRGDITFEIDRRGDDLFETEYQTGASGEPIFKSSYKLEYAIGSGMNGATYLLRRGLHHGHAAVHVERLPRDVARLVAGEIDAGRRDVGSLAQLP